MKDRRESVSKSVSSELVFVNMRYRESCGSHYIGARYASGSHSVVAMIIGRRVLRLGQPPDRIGADRVGSDLSAFARIEAFQTEIESGQATEELAEFIPGIFPPVDNDHGRAVTFIDPSVNRGALRVKAILTSPLAREIGGAQIPYRKTCFNCSDQLGVRVTNRRLRRLENGKLISARTAFHAFERPDSQASAHMNHEVERVLPADRIAADNRLEVDSLQLR